GVRLLLSAQGRLAATTSRIGIKGLSSGRAWFVEMVPVGEPIPAAGLTKRAGGFGLFYGANPIPILENAGTRDEMVLDNGRPNPNIQELGRFVVDVPEDAAADDLQNLELELQMDASMALRMSVYV